MSHSNSKESPAFRPGEASKSLRAYSAPNGKKRQIVRLL